MRSLVVSGRADTEEPVGSNRGDRKPNAAGGTPDESGGASSTSPAEATGQDGTRQGGRRRRRRKANAPALEEAVPQLTGDSVQRRGLDGAGMSAETNPAHEVLSVPTVSSTVDEPAEVRDKESTSSPAADGQTSVSADPTETRELPESAREEAPAAFVSEHTPTGDGSSAESPEPVEARDQPVSKSGSAIADEPAAESVQPSFMEAQVPEASVEASLVTEAGSFDRGADLPYPLAWATARWKVPRQPIARTREAFRGIGIVSQWLAAVMVGWRSDHVSERVKAEMASAIVCRTGIGQRVSPAAWTRVAWRLAAHIAPVSEGAIGQLARGMVEATELSGQVQAAMQSVGRSDSGDRVQEGEATATELLDRVIQLTEPLGALTMASVECRAVVAADDWCAYQVRSHRGTRLGTAQRLWTSDKLVARGCYLLDGETVVADLAPYVFAGVCAECGEGQIYLSDVAVVEKGGCITGTALACGHEGIAPKKMQAVLRHAQIWLS